MIFSSRQPGKFDRKKAKAFCLILALCFSFGLLTAQPAHAQVSIVGSVPDTIKMVWDKLMDYLKTGLRKTGSAAVQSVIRNALNRLAYDAATYIGSGNDGQGKFYEDKSWGDILGEARDDAAGAIIEDLSKEFGTNLCKPDLSVQLKIGLGLKAQTRPGKPDCSWQDLQKNWSTAMKKEDFLKTFASSFEPTSNDLGMSLTMNSQMMQNIAEKEKVRQAELVSKQGNKEKRNIGDQAETPPQEAQKQADATKQAQAQNVGKTTDDPFVDAANVFLNQLALTFFNTLMKKLTDSTKGGGPGESLLSADSDPNSGGGAAGLRKTFSKALTPTFNSRGDYDIIGELTVCNPGLGGVGPTNCVINDRFAQAIQQKKTVGQALNEGLLPKDAAFGFKTSGASAIEPSYLEGIPYRSMIILRKFRIIPVGWEIAAQKINGDLEARKNAYLGRLVECFSDNDSYEGYSADWCRGLVDPDWVFKAPQNYCAKEGYGPQIIYSQAVDQGIDSITMSEDKNNNGTLDTGEDLNNNKTIDDYTITVNIPPKFLVNRLDTYCADEQSCIKEKNDGSCEYYGYCSEERRKWDFGADSCEPIYNSCQTFKGEGGESLSYLKNTLEFCTSENFGCERYAKGGISSYDAAAKKNDWSRNDGYAFFNNNIQECDADSEGCHEFLRIRADVGTNLIRNSGFELNTAGDIVNSLGWIGSPTEPSDDTTQDVKPETFWMIWGGNAFIADNAPGRGGNTLFINTAQTSGSGFYSMDQSSGQTSSILPKGFVMEPETTYTLSADIYNVNADRVVLMIGRQGQYWEQKEITSKGSWIRASVTIKNNPEILANEIRIFGYGSGNIQFYIDNVKFEVGSGKDANGNLKAYSEYRQNNLVYQRLLPKYLEVPCYFDYAIGDYRFKPDAPAVCRNFSRKCNRDEANCEMFSSNNGAKIPAAVTDKDYCLAECSGFDAYVQSENNFNTRRAFYFIPKTAKKCSVDQAGCEEFTNLDKSGQGGESREYYSYLRQCIKPNSPGNTCATFYTWEGNNEQGEQLSSHVLRAAASGDVALTSNDSSACNETIFNYSPTDPGYNPDCRKIYNQAGAVSYHLYARTISCTDDCHPYRMTNKNVNEWASASPSNCSYFESSGIGHWDSASNSCYYCENGGYWSTEHNACIYNATPGESIACPGNANGCAEFNGNQGNDVRQLFLSTFENGADGWSSGNAVVTGVVSGKQSWKFSSEISRTIGYSVKRGGSYTLSFVAKPSGAASVNVFVSLYNGTVTDYFSTSTGIDGVEVKPNEWGLYQFNLPALDHDVNDSERLVISADGLLNIDNIKLSAISERYYLIRDSWVTPASCNQDEKGNPYPLYMLGCSQYKDRLNNTHYLHKFSRICQESAVGCEAMIDTQNSTRQTSEYFSTGNGTLVNADRVIYAVYDPNKKCKSASKGCELLGLSQEYENSYIFSDSYKKNDPDKYNSILCTAEGVGCDKWSSSDGDYYFKDPGDMVCEWKQANVGGKVVWNWFKKKVKRCNGTGDICSSDANCLNKRCDGTGAVCTSDNTCAPRQVCKPDGSGGTTCKMDERNIDCPVTNLKTFGQGGIGNEVYQPAKEVGFNWVGLCSADQSGCTEYIDPVSDFSSNLVYNPDFRQDIDKNSLGDGWNDYDAFNLSSGVQKIFLEGNNVYSLTVESANSYSATLDATPSGVAVDFRPFYQLDDSNILVEPSIVSLTVNGSSSAIFFVEKNAQVKLIVSDRGTGANAKIILKKVVTDYQLAPGVDKTSCTGAANQSNGCVYFNERSISGAEGLSALDKNAWQEYGREINGLSNANKLIKVGPDRVCNQWLSCKTYIKGSDGKPVCFDIANCNRLDKGGNCANFAVLRDDQKDNRTYDNSTSGMENPETIKNLSGYVKVGYEETSADKFSALPNNLLDIGFMEQSGTEVKVSNGNFELHNKVLNSKENGYNYTPAGWSPYDSVLTPRDPSGIFDVIQDPVSAQKAGVNYPAEGVAFLRYSAASASSSPFSDAIRVTPDTEYYLSYIIDTTGMIGGSNSQAKIDIMPRGVSTPTHTFYTPTSQSWKVQTHKFFSSAPLINIRLGATAGSGGDVYIDDIKISPVLKIKESADVYVSQSCRLYPKEDSLSCDYRDDAGMRLKGDAGYCLEYDRAPGNPNACLLWWPIDKVSGQGAGGAVKESTPYSGPAPLFYCVGANINRPYIDANETWYAVDEKMVLKVNNTPVTSEIGYEANSTPITGPEFSCDSNIALLSESDDCEEILDVRCDNFWMLNNPGCDTPESRKTAYLNNSPASAPSWMIGENNPYNCVQGTPANIVKCTKKSYVSAASRSGSLPLNSLLPDSDVDKNSGKIYLKYGKNKIDVQLESENGGGVTYALLAGKFYYWDNAGVKHMGIFDLTGQAITQKTPEVSEKTSLEAGGDAKAKIRNCRLRLGMSPNIVIPDFLGGGRAAKRTRQYFVIDEDNNDGTCEDGSKHSRWASFYIFVPYFGCSSIAQVVDRNGANKVWVERFKESSGYETYCNTHPREGDIPAIGMPSAVMSQIGYVGAEGEGVTVPESDGTCAYSADYTPYGSVVNPGTSEFERSQPEAWGALNPVVVNVSDGTGDSPLLYKSAAARMGQLYSSTSISYLFAESFGIWDWNATAGSYVLNNNSPLAWTSPTVMCPNNSRSGKFDNCSVRPDIKNIKLNAGTNTSIFGRGFVNLTFNSQVDAQQAPLTMYEIDWGDLEKLTVSGQDMKDMPNIDDPHSAFHAYDYWDIKGKIGLSTNADKMPTAICSDIIDPQHPKPYCSVKPKVKVKDNWGWCSEGRAGTNGSCPTPANAVCVDSGVPSGITPISKPNCRNYMSSVTALNMCPVSAQYCSDGYYEAGEVIVYEY